MFIIPQGEITSLWDLWLIDFTLQSLQAESSDVSVFL